MLCLNRSTPVSYLYIPDIPRIEFQKNKAFFFSFLLAVRSHDRYQKISYIGRGLSTDEFENKTRSTVECFPSLFLYFVTRAVIGSSTPRFQSVNTFQAREENNRSFTH